MRTGSLLTNPRIIQHDGARRFVWPCRILRCKNHCDPDGDVRLLCVEHVAMVPCELLDAMDTAEDVATYKAVCDRAVKYADDVDAVING